MSVVLGYLFLVLVLVARAWQYCAVLDRMVWPPSAWIIRLLTNIFAPLSSQKMTFSIFSGDKPWTGLSSLNACHGQSSRQHEEEWTFMVERRMSRVNKLGGVFGSNVHHSELGLKIDLRCVDIAIELFAEFREDHVQFSSAAKCLCSWHLPVKP